MEIDHFSHGWLTPVVAYVMSFTGSLLGLRCMSRVRSGSPFDGWLIAASVAIGGTGIWVMHFIAMLGFRINGAAIKYDVPVTLISAAIAMVVVWAGLCLAQQRRLGGQSLLVGGVVTGIGVGAMHYAGMYAMKTDVEIGYEWSTVTLSMVIAVIAATAALWFTLNVRGTLATVGAALVMGVAVAGMHYTGMYAMHLGTPHHMTPSGAGAAQLLTPLIVGVSLMTVGMLFHLGLTEVSGGAAMARRPAADNYWPTRD
ncbi:MHYT domain-containing protein [Nocardia jinanensis]|uniref:Membrane protein n=1 Tax=Nocardia jinanensis TaxID=382504 RepID=A0A917VP03_9NOCA|nr:MHYT domain-containing protein [Nocardia jinanensis]GGL00138.1 membrane protein [Nocardia jinanensis]